ncbi:MAG: T9SS type A sorting domain-containing protein [Flavobacteriales bacterium]|nr:T9SS type A sorting domain-containing protein [Flavobacteriales bacterium]
MDLAFIYARAGSGGAYASVEALKLRADSVQAAYDAYGIGCGSYPSMVSVPDVQAHEQVRLFPNPAHDRVTVMADTPVKGLELLDAQGRLVLTASPTGTRSTLDLRGLMPGFYAVRIHTTVQTHVHRLVVH